MSCTKARGEGRAEGEAGVGVQARTVDGWEIPKQRTGSCSGLVTVPGEKVGSGASSCREVGACVAPGSVGAMGGIPTADSILEPYNELSKP